jgi:tRNA(His) 5'-end guanylyltransferase
MFFDGKLQKMVSILAADCTLYFNRLVAERLPHKVNARPMFDCRVFQVPAEYEATNCLIWREKDAVRNSISMAAHHCKRAGRYPESAADARCDVSRHRPAPPRPDLRPVPVPLRSGFPGRVRFVRRVRETDHGRSR